MKVLYITILFMCVSFLLSASDDKKTIRAVKIESKVVIDGWLKESAWNYGQIATDFIQTEPNPGASPRYQTEVRIIYDDEAIYLGAILYDTQPELILRELETRDRGSNSDRFFVTIDTYQDGQNGYQFEVSAAGVQRDLKYSFAGRDDNWDAVWESEVQIKDNGWIVEMKIPYQALRFPEKNLQVWNIQFGREIRRFRELSYWNEIDPLQEGYLNQSGQLEGIQDIKPPTRFTLMPFVATYLNTSYDPSSPDQQFNAAPAYTAGMDMKLGLSDAFTLDMALIPDFGQTRSDNQILNLSPFEVRFDENRQFFVEGTELFDKGNVFYSRRVGGRPLNYQAAYENLEEGEVVASNPDISSLYNATKISGRTVNGLGIGVFNAVAAEEYAVIQNQEGKIREVKTSPLTNYSMVVFDQNLSNNSYITFLNTNVLRDGSDYDANVTGFLFERRNKAQSYQVSGGVNITQRYFSDASDIGHQYRFGLEKTKGKWRGSVFYLEESDNYNANDLGFVFSPNERTVSTDFSYNEVEPIGDLISYNCRLGIGYRRLYAPNVFSDFGINFSTFFLMKSRFAFGLRSRLEPIETFDYFEPRSVDFRKYFVWPVNFYISPWISSDYRRMFAIDANIGYRYYQYDGRRDISLRMAPRLRINDKFSFRGEIEVFFANLQAGYLSKSDAGNALSNLSEEDILFGERDRSVVENAISGKYIFNNKMALTFRVRHYWDLVQYQSFAILDGEGLLATFSFDGLDEGGQPIYDRNFNIFNIDLNYIWRFAPGSDIIFNWQNQISGSYSDFQTNYFYNASRLFDEVQQNRISLKVIYWLDYNQLFS